MVQTINKRLKNRSKKKSSTKPWQTKAWKQQRAVLIKNASCEWCGSKEFLTVHHRHNIRRIRKFYFNKVARALIKYKMDVGEIKQQYKTYRECICPTCSNRQKIGQRIKNYFSCKYCRNRIELSWVKITRKRELDYFLSKLGYKQFIKEYKDEINRILTLNGIPDEPNYLNLNEDTMILCRRCHFANENGLSLCPVCKKKYMGPQYNRCYGCLPDEAKKRIEERKKVLHENY